MDSNAANAAVKSLPPVVQEKVKEIQESKEVKEVKETKPTVTEPTGGTLSDPI